MADIVPVGEKEIRKESQEVAILEFLGITLEDELIGFPLTEVLSISKVTEIVPVPFSPPYIVGVINLRGDIIPILSLKSRLGLPENKEYTMVVILDTSFGKVGILVDKVVGVIKIPADRLEPNPMTGRYSRYIRNVAKTDQGLLIIIDIDRITKESSL